MNLTFKGIDIEAYAVVFGLAVEARGIGHIACNCELVSLSYTIERILRKVCAAKSLNAASAPEKLLVDGMLLAIVVVL